MTEARRGVVVTDIDGVLLEQHTWYTNPIKNSTKMNLNAMPYAAEGLRQFAEVLDANIYGLTRRPEWLRRSSTEADISRHGIPLDPIHIHYGVRSEDKAQWILTAFTESHQEGGQTLFPDPDTVPVPLIDDRAGTVLKGLLRIAHLPEFRKMLPYLILVNYGTQQEHVHDLAKALNKEGKVKVHGSFNVKEHVHTLQVVGDDTEIRVVSMASWRRAEDAAETVKRIQESFTT